MVKLWTLICISTGLSPHAPSPAAIYVLSYRHVILRHIPDSCTPIAIRLYSNISPLMHWCSIFHIYWAADKAVLRCVMGGWDDDVNVATPVNTSSNSNHADGWLWFPVTRFDDETTHIHDWNHLAKLSVCTCLQIYGLHVRAPTKHVKITYIQDTYIYDSVGADSVNIWDLVNRWSNCLRMRLHKPKSFTALIAELKKTFRMARRHSTRFDHSYMYFSSRLETCATTWAEAERFWSQN